jgi:hypothetical protein
VPATFRQSQIQHSRQRVDGAPTGESPSKSIGYRSVTRSNMSRITNAFLDLLGIDGGNMIRCEPATALDLTKFPRFLSRKTMVGSCSLKMVPTGFLQVRFQPVGSADEYSKLACECAASEPALMSTNSPTRTLYSGPHQGCVSSNTNVIVDVCCGKNTCWRTVQPYLPFQGVTEVLNR